MCDEQSITTELRLKDSTELRGGTGPWRSPVDGTCHRNVLVLGFEAVEITLCTLHHWR